MARIVCVYFQYENETTFPKMVKALRYSADVHTTLPLEVVKLKPTHTPSNRHMESNNNKLSVWNEFVQDAKEDLILIDADTLITGSMKSGFDLTKDVGITFRDYGQGFPLNAGVVYVKNTPDAKKIMKEWVRADLKLKNDIKLLTQFRTIYAGMNQASLGYLLYNGLQVSRLPMSRYNLCEDWSNHQNAELVHLKGRLRMWINQKEYNNHPVSLLWKNYYFSSNY